MSYEVAEVWTDLSYDEQKAILESMEDDEVYAAID